MNQTDRESAILGSFHIHCGEIITMLESYRTLCACMQKGLTPMQEESLEWCKRVKNFLDRITTMRIEKVSAGEIDAAYLEFHANSFRKYTSVEGA